MEFETTMQEKYRVLEDCLKDGAKDFLPKALELYKLGPLPGRLNEELNSRLSEAVVNGSTGVYYC